MCKNIRSEYQMITPKDKAAYIYYKQQNTIVRLVGRRPAGYIVGMHATSDFRNTSCYVDNIIKIISPKRYFYFWNRFRAKYNKLKTVKTLFVVFI